MCFSVTTSLPFWGADLEIEANVERCRCFSVRKKSRGIDLLPVDEAPDFKAKTKTTKCHLKINIIRGTPLGFRSMQSHTGQSEL